MTWAFLLLLLLSTASAISPSTSQVNLRISLSKDIQVDGQVTYANFTAYDFPQVEGQQVSLLSGGGFSIDQDAYGNARLVHKWEGTDELDYRFQVGVETHMLPPLETAPASLTVSPGIAPYLAPAEYTEVTPEIEAKARELIEGARDPFEEAARLADWVNTNVEYEISYGGVVLGAQQVFKQKQGTCDEFAHLFISMARSIGIPARYVSGIVYGTLGLQASGTLDWYNHGWAEVWLGEWVPFDPTYGQFGYVDGSHVKFAAVPSQKSLESRLEWIPNTVNIEVGDLEYDVEVVESRDFEAPLQQISLEPIDEVNGTGPIRVKAKVSGNQGCIAAKVRLAHHPDFKAPEPERLVITCPGDEKELEWTLTPPALEEGFTYTYDVIVSNGLSEAKGQVIFKKPKIIVERPEQSAGDALQQMIDMLLEFINSLIAKLNL